MCVFFRSLFFYFFYFFLQIFFHWLLFKPVFLKVDTVVTDDTDGSAVINATIVAFAGVFLQVRAKYLVYQMLLCLLSCLWLGAYLFINVHSCY